MLKTTDVRIKHNCQCNTRFQLHYCKGCILPNQQEFQFVSYIAPTDLICYSITPILTLTIYRPLVGLIDS